MERLRRYHNMVKTKALSEALQGRDAPNTSLLDLACGPGSDLHKWHRLGIHDAMGLDASEEAILEARKRNKTCKTAYRFVIADVCNRLERYARQERWDVITCNFAIHYLMEDPEKFANLLSAVSGALKPGGYFIGTVQNGDRVDQLMGNSSSYRNNILSVRRAGDIVEFDMHGTYYFENGASREMLVLDPAGFVCNTDLGINFWDRTLQHLAHAP
ncbi:mRNA capping enzyme family protein [Klebsormidium nitens]|uniref:mRNA (guanine-N(7))-methyltransferase n=1 Tax=Klebsormidium nitens TaxID=105231 RepID=A0A1Y1IJV0_KLENI|nr:mRNA capping enzyme family protein [Klebsormidium nitens]|eukprot:GAQ91110.1 mRNA capping enzyme family protein [Klebsormidium nitens]